jgi:hypothetical protein
MPYNDFIRNQPMTYDEVYEMICRMETYGGSFVVALAGAMRKADASNKNRLILAFPEYVQEYGPDSKFPVPTKSL